MITALIALAAVTQKPVFETRKYPDYFALIGKSGAETKARVDQTYQQFFHGKADSETVYFESGPDEAYILDVGDKDVRTEGMSYGMMISVQLDHKAEFDKIWKWVKTHMQHQSGPLKGYFGWQCKTDGSQLADAPASDGEEYFATALYFASGRWGNGEGIFNYRKEADAILDTCLHMADGKDALKDPVQNMFNRSRRQVVFVPTGDAALFTDPSYHLPAFYELWSRWAAKDRVFWRDTAVESREFFKRSAHPTTGLFPDYASFDGKPQAPKWDPKSNHVDFNFDAWRVAMNMAIDYIWFKADPIEQTLMDRQLQFFLKQGLKDYKATFKVSGEPTATYRSEGLIAMNAVSASVVGRSEFIQALWDQPTPTGQWRYYNGMLHMLAMLFVSGNYRIYEPK